MPKSTDEKKTKITVQDVTVPVKWNVPEYIITRFASNMVVQVLEDAFRISFFDIRPDIRLDENQKPPEEIQADCVASVVITANKLPSFIKVLQQQCDVYEKRTSQDTPVKP